MFGSSHFQSSLQSVIEMRMQEETVYNQGYVGACEHLITKLETVYNYSMFLAIGIALMVFGLFSFSSNLSFFGKKEEDYDTELERPSAGKSMSDLTRGDAA